MTKTLTLILGDQLFKDHPSFETDTDFMLLESDELCRRYNYHQIKLAFILTSMRNYGDFLRAKLSHCVVHYFDLVQNAKFETVLQELSQTYDTLQFTEISDKRFSRFIQDLAQKYFKAVNVLSCPMFLTSKVEFKSYLSGVKVGKPRLMADFYVWQRRRLNLLMDVNGRPLGGKWSFDEDNRKKLSAKIDLPQRVEMLPNTNYLIVKNLIESKFRDNPGSLDNWWLSTTHEEAETVLQRFLDNFLFFFGDYEDALSYRDDFLFHSALSPYLNNGLLTPGLVLQKLMEHLELNNWLVEDHFNSIEGFVRQIIGWREWIKGMYDNFYELTDYNFFDAHQNLPDYFYFKDLPNLKNEPLQLALQKVEKLGWSHHIERLMVFGNYMTLTEIEPKQAFTWFMEMYVDAYDWVMIPNVYGMGTFADGGIFASKPYISGANYLRKMGNYNSGEWEQEWTDLFWNFLRKHETFFLKQPRMAMLLNRKK